MEFPSVSELELSLDQEIMKSGELFIDLTSSVALSPSVVTGQLEEGARILEQERVVRGPAEPAVGVAADQADQADQARAPASSAKGSDGAGGRRSCLTRRRGASSTRRRCMWRGAERRSSGASWTTRKATRGSGSCGRSRRTTSTTWRRRRAQWRSWRGRATCLSSSTRGTTGSTCRTTSW